MQIFVVFCFMVVTGEPSILNLRGLTDNNARTRTHVVGSIDYKSAIADIVRIQNFEVLTHTELIIYVGSFLKSIINCRCTSLEFHAIGKLAF